MSGVNNPFNGAGNCAEVLRGSVARKRSAEVLAEVLRGSVAQKCLRRVAQWFGADCAEVFGRRVWRKCSAEVSGGSVFNFLSCDERFLTPLIYIYSPDGVCDFI